MSSSVVRVGLLGCGNVGASLAQMIASNGDAIAERAGVRLQITQIAVRDLSIDRGLPTNTAVMTDDPAAVVAASDVDLVVEVMGGIEPARTLILAALAAGKPVVTANKALLAAAGAELFAAAEAGGVDLLFEASVCGGIPLMRPLRESLAGDRILRVTGIVNGTTNYILTRMTEAGQSFADALAEAQALGFAEADPTADVEAHDAAAKAAIIASIAFGAEVTDSDVYREGITSITAADIEAARELGYVVKLLAVAEERDGKVGARVHPAMVPVQHPLASVREAFNAVFIEGEATGEVMLYGRGAGGFPTASAVLGDVIDAAKNLASGGRGATIGKLVRREMLPMEGVVSQYYLELEAADRPGVLAVVADVFGRHEVSIESMQQRGIGEDARLIFVTHAARESDLRSTVAELRETDAVLRVGSVLRVLGSGE
ncbi:MAG: homoserine dehydrogenase [Actinobacteria bacterium]|uniref:Homoserine dehydrogenase n=2 Tax=freshwater metagenome TaxID=449393 RepID=A0A6J7CEI3_9ZZZZ|nr:homoserine dehydrogenase [Actinomycetota bacterium]